MVWPMLAVMVGSSLMQGAMADRQNKKDVKAHNKEVRRQDRLREHEAAVAQLQIDNEKKLLRQQATKSIDLARREADRQAGAVNASAAAAAVKGATVDAVAQVVEHDLQEREYEIKHQSQQGLEDLDAQIKSHWSYAKNGGQQPAKYKSQMGQYLAQGVLNAASTYAGQYFKFGSGTGNVATGGK